MWVLAPLTHTLWPAPLRHQFTALPVIRVWPDHTPSLLTANPTATSGETTARHSQDMELNASDIASRIHSSMGHDTETSDHSHSPQNRPGLGRVLDMPSSRRTGSSLLLVQGREPQGCSTSRGQTQSLIWDSDRLTHMTFWSSQATGCQDSCRLHRGSILILVRQSPLFTLHRSQQQLALTKRGISQTRHRD